jgi:hypothetical protein
VTYEYITQSLSGNEKGYKIQLDLKANSDIKLYTADSPLTIQKNTREQKDLFFAKNKDGDYELSFLLRPVAQNGFDSI